MSPHEVLNEKIPDPSRKKGRRSSKNCSKADKFNTAGSASTWPKSGLIVALSVRFDESPYLRSAPADMDCGWLQELPDGRVSFLVTTYGASSRRLGRPSPLMPVSSPVCEMYPCWS